MDPDFGMNIVECGFVKDLNVDDAAGSVGFRLELTTPACPIKDEFERQAYSVVEALPWVNEVRCPRASVVHTQYSAYSCDSLGR